MVQSFRLRFRIYTIPRALPWAFMLKALGLLFSRLTVRSIKAECLVLMIALHRISLRLFLKHFLILAKIRVRIVIVVKYPLYSKPSFSDSFVIPIKDCQDSRV